MMARRVAAQPCEAEVRHAEALPSAAEARTFAEAVRTCAVAVQTCVGRERKDGPLAQAPAGMARLLVPVLSGLRPVLPTILRAAHMPQQRDYST
jgi:hypothetical protein